MSDEKIDPLDEPCEINQIIETPTFGWGVIETAMQAFKRRGVPIEKAIFRFSQRADLRGQPYQLLTTYPGRKK
jgi:hypothetical protein